MKQIMMVLAIALTGGSLQAKHAQAEIAEITVKCENLLDEHGDTAMHIAVKDDDVDILECLKKHEIQVDIPIGFNEEIAMHFAALNNSVNAMKWLKAQGSDINAPNSYNKTPIHYAAEHNAVAAMEWLKVQGADINAGIHYKDPGAIENWNNYYSWLMAQVAYLDAINNNYTPMHFAAANNAVNAMKWLETQGVDVNVRNPRGETPMHRAAAALNDNRDAMEWLQAQGVNVNVRDASDRTPMHFAASFGILDALNWLETQGADINARDRDGNTPLHDATDNNNMEAMQWFRIRGTDINVRNKAGETPLHRAVAEAASHLAMQNDLPVSFTNAMTGFEKSETTKIENTIKWLLDQEADVNAQDKNGHTPEHLAAQGNAVNTLKLLQSRN